MGTWKGPRVVWSFSSFTYPPRFFPRPPFPSSDVVHSSLLRVPRSLHLLRREGSSEAKTERNPTRGDGKGTSWERESIDETKTRHTTHGTQAERLFSERCVSSPYLPSFTSPSEPGSARSEKEVIRR
mgnify:CR=1 FL=1